jgi:hypothetical protein
MAEKVEPEDFQERRTSGRRPEAWLFALVVIWAGVCIGASIWWQSELPFAAILLVAIPFVLWNEHRRRCPQCRKRLKVRYVSSVTRPNASTRVYDCAVCRVAWNTGQIIDHAD